MPGDAISRDRQPLRVESLLRKAQLQAQPPVPEVNTWTLDDVSGLNVTVFTDRAAGSYLTVMAYLPDLGILHGSTWSVDLIGYNALIANPAI